MHTYDDNGICQVHGTYCSMAPAEDDGTGNLTALAVLKMED